MSFKKIIAPVLALSLLTGCGASSFNSLIPSYDGGYYEGSRSAYSEEYALDDIAYGEDQRVSYAAHAQAETKTYKEDNQKLEALMDTYDVVLKSQNSYQYQDYMEEKNFTETYYSLEVPKDNFDGFIEEIKSSFTLSSFSLDSEDIGSNIDSLSSRLKAVEEEIKNIEGILEEGVDDPATKLDLEVQLGDLRAEKLDLEESLTSTEDTVDFARVNFTLREVARFYNESPSLFDNFKYAFKGFFQQAIGLLAMSLMSLFFVIPYIIVGVATYITTRKLIKRFVDKANYKEKKKEEKLDKIELE